MSRYQDNNIEVLLERLESLKIMNKVLGRTIKYTDDIPITPVPIQESNIQAGISKSMVPNTGWFNRNRTKFEDWWREMRLFLKSNKVMETSDRITAILAYLRGGIVGIYAQKKLNELDKEIEIQDWNEFIQEIKIIFSDKTKAADAEWKIEMFEQGKKNMADFIIEFKALAMKADTDKLHAIFLLKKNIWVDIVKTILGYPPITAPETLKEWKMAITLVEQEYEFTKGQHDYQMRTRITYRG